MIHKASWHKTQPVGAEEGSEGWRRWRWLGEVEEKIRYVYFKQGRYGESNIEKICVINTITYIFLKSPYPEVLPLIFIFKKIR